jgi:hypothetical protein
MGTNSQMHDKAGLHLPVELGPIQRTYVVLASVIGFPALLWFIGILLGKKMPVGLLGVCVAGATVMVIYVKNMTIRLDEVGISQGFSIFRRFMRYESISGVHREVRSGKGASTTVLVVSGQDAAGRIIIPLPSFDQIKLTQTMALLARKAPQAHIEDALYVQLHPW